MANHNSEDPRVPPHDIEAEMCLIGSLLLAGDDVDLAENICSLLRPDAFYQADHGIYFDAISRMRKAGKKIDSVLMKSELIRAGLFGEVGGMPYMMALLDKVPSAGHGIHYAQVVREKYQLREVIRIGTKAISQAWASSRHDKAGEIASKFLDELTAVAHLGSASNIVTLGEAVTTLMENYGTQVAKRIKTGLFELDDLTGGLPIQGFTIIAGRPGMGKSQLAKQFALNMAGAEDPHRIGIITIEENRGKIAQNLLANASGIENSKISHGNASAEEIDEMIIATTKLANLPIFISDEPTKLRDVEGAIREMVHKHKCKVIVVDYLQLIEADEESDTVREITQISNRLKRAFRRHDVAGIAVCQLNRGNESQGTRPLLKNLRGSGTLEQDTDLALLLHREDYYHKGEDGYQTTDQIEIIIGKNKDGATGTVPAWFSGRYQAVTDWNGGQGSYFRKHPGNFSNNPF